MSTATTLTITSDSGIGAMPDESWLITALVESTDAGWPTGIDGDFTATPTALVVQWFDTRWSIEGILTVARRLSVDWPDTTVEVVEEWDARDADAPGSYGRRYRRGKLIARGAQTFAWQEV